MRVWLASLLGALVLWAQPAFAQTLSQSEFRDAAIALIRSEDPSATIDVLSELSLHIRRSNKELPEFTLNLDNAYREYTANPAAMTDVLDRYVRFATQPLENARLTERVVTVLRARAMADEVAALAQQQPDGSIGLIWRPFAGDLIEVLVFDGAETIQYATEQSVADTGLTIDAAWALAPTNLPARLGGLEVGGVEGADQLVYVTGGNGLAPSSLIDGRMCSREGGATYVFIVVERNGYVMADSANSAARLQFQALLADLRRSGESMSLTPLGCRDGRVAAITLTE